MALIVVKSAEITNLDAVPVVTNTSGEGAPGYVKSVTGIVASVTAAANVDSIFRMVRVRSNIKLKALKFSSEAQTAGKFDIGAYYATDGSSVNAKATQVAADAISRAFFAAAVDCASAVNNTDELNQAATANVAKRNYPLWKLLGLATDPGGNFDICLTVVTTAVTTGTGAVALEAAYVD